MNKQHKIQAALDALKMTTPGDWWVDDFSDLKDGVGGPRLEGRGPRNCSRPEDRTMTRQSTLRRSIVTAAYISLGVVVATLATEFFRTPEPKTTSTDSALSPASVIFHTKRHGDVKLDDLLDGINRVLDAQEALP
jgi:hypothetical protein